MAVVSAVGLAVPARPGRWERMESAMRAELLKVHGEGVTNPVAIRQRMEAARAKAERKFLTGKNGQ